jgi:hypothetical protein
MSTSLQREHTVAIALNNVGVSLLERGSYHESMEAFRDAVSVMNEISATSHQQKISRKRPISSSALDAKLRKANYSLSVCDPVQDSNMTFCVLTEEESESVIGVALQDETTFFDYTTTFLIRIEKSMLNCENTNVDLQSSIMLQNFGSVFKCLAFTAPSAACAKQYCKDSFKLFQLSYSLLKRDIEGSLPVSILILRSLFSSLQFLEWNAKQTLSTCRCWPFKILFLKWVIFLINHSRQRLLRYIMEKYSSKYLL